MPGSDSPATVDAAARSRGRLVLLCGRSFSGKSTAASVLRQALPAQVVSLDGINAERGLDGGQGVSVEDWTRTNDEARERVSAVLRTGGTVRSPTRWGRRSP